MYNLESSKKYTPFFSPTVLRASRCTVCKGEEKKKQNWHTVGPIKLIEFVAGGFRCDCTGLRNWSVSLWLNGARKGQEPSVVVCTWNIYWSPEVVRGYLFPGNIPLADCSERGSDLRQNRLRSKRFPFTLSFHALLSSTFHETDSNVLADCEICWFFAREN